MPPPPRPAAAAGIVVVAWAVILGLVLGIGWLITDQARASVEPWDDDISRWIADRRSSRLDPAGDAGTLLGDTVVGWSVAAVGAIAFALWRRSWLPALFVGLLAAGTGGFYVVATHVASRPRPPVQILDPGLVPDHSFPSGHVATAFAAYGGLVVLAWMLARASRRWVWALLVLPVLVLLARLYEGAHHLTDVLTSVVYTTAWLAVLAWTVLTRVGGDGAAGGRGASPGRHA